MVELYPLWFAHLWDNIPTVREDSAVALRQALEAYGQEALDLLLPVVRCGWKQGGSAALALRAALACGRGMSSAANSWATVRRKANT